ncbi:MAG: AraC family transcriptional regulator [Chitinispirillia bacterium]
MKTNLTNNVSISEISNKLFCSERHLRRAFIKITGENTRSYLLKLKKEKAKKLLEETNLSIAEIALDSGFTSHTRLTDAFRLKEGIKPLNLK